MKASPNITTMYLNIEITREENPFPKASKEPDTVIDREETINPALIKRRAVQPISMVASLSENSPIRY